ncbi:hypothetical protein [Ferrovum sp.]|uniref:SDH family Clp fold serine proteinase n=1 Tax=Ferrovum sp. TaxID=2609467 RepID=UPI002617AD16|nr:hypothetical protein [Ferrovum sp.]
MDLEEISKAATSLADIRDADIVLCNAGMERPLDAAFIEMCNKAKRRKNVMLFLCTRGGDAGAAYRIARCLQEKYERFTIYICGICKSAGTLVAVGAHEIVMSNFGEIGPLDVQLGKKDEIWENDSGLTVLNAISALEGKAFDLFEDCFLNLKRRSLGRITLKTATDLAAKLATGMISPIVSQIDPMHVGEASRAMNIGTEYGNRLIKKSENADADTIRFLAHGYPDHGFVIDRSEAIDLFRNVRDLSEDEEYLVGLLGFSLRDQASKPILTYLSNSKNEDQHETNHQGVNGEGPQEGSTGDGDFEKTDDATTLQSEGCNKVA